MQQNKGQQSKSPDQILQSITKDRWNFLDDIDLTRQAEEAAGKDNVKEPVMSSEEHWKVLQRSQTDLARLSEPIAERCSPTKRNTEHGGQSTSGSSSADLCQMKYQA